MFFDMFKRKKIKVTPNVEHCLNVFEKVTQSLPEGDMKKEAQGAATFLREASKGDKKPLRATACPTWTIIPPVSTTED